MATEVIALTAQATPNEVLATARTVVENLGYRWVRSSGTTAEAHEGGQLITRKRSRKLKLGLEFTPGELTLTQLTNGAVDFATERGALPAMRVRRRLRTVSDEIAAGLTAAGLTA